jgi:hypothetical protein
MGTQEYPQLQSPTAGAPPATSPYGAPPAYYGPPTHPGAVPPIPPRARSAGFWVGVSAAITLGVVGALLIGFFIGRGTRLSNDSVQGKIVQQSQADQIAEQQALDAQKATLAKNEKRALDAARKSAYSAGRTAGFTAGQQAGFSSGQSEGFAQGQATGAAQGETAGFSQGLNQGACLANSIFCSGG